MKMKKNTPYSMQDKLKLRILKIKTMIPNTFDYCPLYVYEFGPQSEEHLTKVRMVWNLRTTDKKITERLEKIAENLKQI